MDLFNDPFHAIALLAFVTEAREAQDWPDSEKVKQRAYGDYEKRKR